MTELEKLKIVNEYLSENTAGYHSQPEIWVGVERRIKECEREEAEEVQQSAVWKDRAERAELEAAELKRSLDVSGFVSEQARKRVAELEAALSEAQDRALRFEKMLVAEEARRDGEIVLEKSRVLTTARNILTMDEKFRYVSTVAFWALVAYLENNGDNAEPYRCQ